MGAEGHSPAGPTPTDRAPHGDGLLEPDEVVVLVRSVGSALDGAGAASRDLRDTRRAPDRLRERKVSQEVSLRAAIRALAQATGMLDAMHVELTGVFADGEEPA